MEIHRADPVARRNAIIVVVVVGVFGAAILHALGESSEGVRAWAERAPERAAKVLFALMVFGVSAPMFGLALWMKHFATKISRAGRYPPPDAKLTRDTRVRTGASALAIARLHNAFAAIAALMAIVAPLLLWRVSRELFGG